MHTTTVQDVRRVLGLSRERLARLLDVSTKTVERWERGDGAPSRGLAQERLAQLAEIVTLGGLVYTPEGLVRLLTTPMPLFGHRTALQLLERGEGEQVTGALAQDYEGQWA